MVTKENSNLRVLFIGKKDDYFSKIASEYFSQNLINSTIVFSSKADKIPEDVLNWKGDYIISYLAQWIIPNSILENATFGGINLHPGTPDYPGIGCTNFAIYNKEKIFGILFLRGRIFFFYTFAFLSSLFFFKKITQI